LRHSSPRLIIGIFCLLFAVAAWVVAPHSPDAFSAEAQTAKPAVAAPGAAQVQTASVSMTKTSPQPKLLPAPGTEVYTAKRGEAIPTIARHYLGKTSYLTSSELAEAIRSVNHKSDSSNILRANEDILIPGILPAPISEKTIPVAKDFEVRAVYLTGVMAASDHGIRIIKHWREVGGNAVVFDIKDSDGSVNIPFEHPLLGEHKVYIHDVPKFVHFLHQQNMHAIARIAMFRYVRFPAEGDQKDAAFVFQNGQEPVSADAVNGQSGATNPKLEVAKTSPEGAGCESPGRKSRIAGKSGDQSRRDGTTAEALKPCTVKPAVPRGPQRSDVIAGFLKKAYGELHPTGVLLSLDVFGVMAWQRQVDLSHTGQDIVQMARYCDVLSPMIYPSHFFGMDNISHPGDEPAHFIGESMDRFELITKGSGVVIRPWLQAFHWRTKTYSPEYIKIQVETAKAKGGDGFLFWNAANDYSKPYEAMPEMKAVNAKEKDKYFRGDELPVPAVQAALIPAR
jgi:hypothetical protein